MHKYKIYLRDNNSFRMDYIISGILKVTSKIEINGNYNWVNSRNINDTKLLVGSTLLLYITNLTQTAFKGVAVRCCVRKKLLG